MNDVYRWPRVWVLALTLLTLISGIIIFGWSQL